MTTSTATHFGVYTWHSRRPSVLVSTHSTEDQAIEACVDLTLAGQQIVSHIVMEVTR